jgi:hypothetical protein
LVNQIGRYHHGSLAQIGAAAKEVQEPRLHNLHLKMIQTRGKLPDAILVCPLRFSDEEALLSDYDVSSLQSARTFNGTHRSNVHSPISQIVE